ncbi:MAG: preprotein translocase subunit YajC [Acidobacteriota bacterium]|jgi:preprotein translocase subunit YajC
MDVSLLFQTEGFAGIGGMLLPLVAIFGIFYFLVIRPQQKQQKKLQEMIASLTINDDVVTNGGVIGKIKEVRESSFVILSADKSFIEVGKSAVVGKKAEAEKQ